MKRLLAWFVLVGLMLAACGGPSETGTGSTSPDDLGAFKAGEPVVFRFDDTVYVCSDQMPYAIVRVTDGEERRVMLQHSCDGEGGRGIDQFCEQGQIRTEEVITCSDAILCEDETLAQGIAWDQQEYVPIREDCAGQTIYREVKEQVGPGQYQVVVQDWVEDHIERRIVAVFAIRSD